MKVIIEGTDFVVTRTVTPDVVAFIAANKRAEDFAWKKTKGNHIRTAFGFTIYAQNEAEKIEMIRAIEAAGMSYWHADV